MINNSDVNVYRAAIGGTWDPGGLPVVTPATLHETSEAATTAVRALLGVVPGEQTEFHILTRMSPDRPVLRSLWRVQLDVIGPQLEVGATAEHESSVDATVTIYPFSELRQVSQDEGVFGTQHNYAMCGLVPALLLRHWWGPSVRPVTLPGLGSGTFTPQTLQWRPRPNTRAALVADYDADGLACYPFARMQGDARPPSMWLAPDAGDPQTGWKVSFCHAGPTAEATWPVDRWDDPAEQVPEFQPLTWEE